MGALTPGGCGPGDAPDGGYMSEAYVVNTYSFVRTLSDGWRVRAHNLSLP
jgi:hypothetical protein